MNLALMSGLLTMVAVPLAVIERAPLTGAALTVALVASWVAHRGQ
jgi:Na+-translocating ferredoxin:NAD+ oxidoreductase RnfC subunit